ncbi:CinA family protein [Kribbella sp. VKM Ac-2568]|uniref:CinA family protein n=1 Tax=Kribbella sp. VKM Ac-2568 TaxID=2512219 RepID=UPI001049CF51|nr:CinA family protein [Kribbella sp. VKM Ac-2568]TCM50246.1 nicotinamide-nucleotide amidase [Kribbella sp. VKM Ac-2568]
MSQEAPTPRGQDAVGTALQRLVELVKNRGETLATAESLTGGLVGAALTDIPGISAIYRGGVVVYATDLKATLAGVPTDLLAQVGPVHSDTAAALAAGVRERLGATYGLATTGVAGPDPQDGIEAGTVYVAAAGPDVVKVRKLSLSGDRATIRRGSVEAVLDLAAELVAEDLAVPGC